MQATILNIAKSRSNNLVSEAEPVDCSYPDIRFGDPGADSPVTRNRPPGLEMQFASVESPAEESGWPLLPAKILTAAVLFASLFFHLLAVLFDLEIRLVNWLIGSGHEHSFHPYKVPRSEAAKQPARFWGC